jgi:bifunctional aspartokinase / homoserine dehydrogenase 1
MPALRTVPRIHKFGGASLADGKAIRHAVTLPFAEGAPAAVIVVSALAGVTDKLLALGRLSVEGDASLRPGLEELAERHREAAEAVLGVRGARVLVREMDGVFATLGRWLVGVRQLRELTPRTGDFIVAQGERLSARLMTAALQASGRKAEYVDATELIATDGRYGWATPDPVRTDRLVRARLQPLLRRKIVPVVPGFIGAAPEQTVATLGRGGSDLTATLIGRALSAESVNLWKDVPGLLTTDPRIVPQARLIPQLNVREASELAFYGAKVLHPRALTPLRGRPLPVRVRPFGDPASIGTEISTRRVVGAHPVKALSMVSGQALVTVAGSGILGVSGIAARTFAALHQSGISVSLITQASSEYSITCCVPASSAAVAREALEREFDRELQQGGLDAIEVRQPMAIVAVVGLGMAGMPGISARVFAALRTAAINVVAIAQGSSELNISVVVEERDAPASVRAIHAEFQLDKIGGGTAGGASHVDVVLLGFGQIGRELSVMMATRASRAKVRLVGVIDSTGVVFDPEGLGARQIAALVKHKQSGKPLRSVRGGRAASAAEAVASTLRHAMVRPVLVDVTADETTTVLQSALHAGMDLVLANKKPLAGPHEATAELRETARRQGRRILQEATVGAGLPVMDTIAKLVETGDRVQRIEGCVSGTLGFLLFEIGRGRPFSQSMQQAMQKGFTEPDPRDDLSGLDVARKALILARLLGYKGELADVRVESLVPSHARAWPLARFLSRLGDFDAVFAERQAAAVREGGVMRYVLDVTSRRVDVGLRVVPASHPLAALRGTDNQIVLTTTRYQDRPLVISGPGAGPAVTAAGVLSDVLKLAAG